MRSVTGLRRALVLFPVLIVPALAAGGEVEPGSLSRLDPIAASAPAPDTGDGLLLLQFWASWCHSCGSLMWDLDELAAEHPELAYYAVSIDESKDQASSYLEDHRLFRDHPGRFYYDANRRLAEMLGVRSVPTVLLVDPAGDIRATKTGHLNGQDLADIVGHIRPAP